MANYHRCLPSIVPTIAVAAMNQPPPPPLRQNHTPMRNNSCRRITYVVSGSVSVDLGDDMASRVSVD